MKHGGVIHRGVPGDDRLRTFTDNGEVFFLQQPSGIGFQKHADFLQSAGCLFGGTGSGILGSGKLLNIVCFADRVGQGKHGKDRQTEDDEGHQKRDASDF